jgi:hypothetical protein
MKTIFIDGDDVVKKFEERDGMYKLVQIIYEGRAYCLLGYDINLHGYILASFLDNKKEKYEKMKMGTFDIPVPKGENYELVGTGFLFIDSDEKSISLSGRSLHYRIKISGTHIDPIKEQFAGWEIKVISD